MLRMACFSTSRIKLFVFITALFCQLSLETIFYTSHKKQVLPTLCCIAMLIKDYCVFKNIVLLFDLSAVSEKENHLYQASFTRVCFFPVAVTGRLFSEYIIFHSVIRMIWHMTETESSWFFRVFEVIYYFAITFLYRFNICRQKLKCPKIILIQVLTSSNKFQIFWAI